MKNKKEVLLTIIKQKGSCTKPTVIYCLTQDTCILKEAERDCYYTYDNFKDDKKANKARLQAAVEKYVELFDDYEFVEYLL